MKKEYLILGVIILCLSLYLAMKKEDQTHYTLPEIKKIDPARIDRIRLDKNGTIIDLRKIQDQWIVGKQKFPAEKSKVENIIDTLKNLKISALVSEKEDRFRYELDKGHAVDVEAFSGQTRLLTFTVGKTAPSYNHTFVMMEEDTRIYQADNSFRTDFDKNLDDFRDKTVLKFQSESIQKLELAKAGKSDSLTASKTEDDKGENTTSWTSDSKRPVDKDGVSGLLSLLSSLNCEKYLKGDQNLPDSPPVCTITLEDEKKMVLTLFAPQDDGRTKGTSTMNDYPFILGSYEAKEIIAHVDKLLGLDKEAEKKSEKDARKKPGE